CTLALYDEGEVCGRHEIVARAHNRHILAMLADLLEGERLEDVVDAIACGVGPGSFTGLRVAVSVAQGLAWSQELPVHGFCSLTAQAYAAGHHGLLQDGDCVLSTIDAQIDQLYGLWGEWREGAFVADEEAFVCAPEDLLAGSARPANVVMGSGARYQERMPDDLTSAAQWLPEVTPDARVMAELLGAGTLALQPEPAHALSPQYVQRDIGWKKLSEQGRRD
ncbi:MAG: tRNA (adenosine(37)-N6)-threonylcarbamoyltransferase complex dimerization subunit type 1 TsaB, partial [Halioglobus sp.]